MGRTRENKINKVGIAKGADTLLLTTPQGKQVFVSTNNFFNSPEIDILSKAETVNDGLVLEGTTNATTSQANYGVNIATTATITDFATRLPTASTGKQVIFINNSLLPIQIFPSVVGGQINGVVDGSAQIPTDGRAYSFYCTDNPLPGAWSWSPPATNQIEINEISVAHTNGADTDIFCDGISANFTPAGLGLDGSGNILPVGNWRTETNNAMISQVKVYSNVLWADLGGVSLPQAITTALFQGYKNSPSGTESGSKHSLAFYGSVGSPGQNVQEVGTGPAYAGNVGDTGTLFMYQTGFSSYPLWQIIGNNYINSIPGILSNGYYTFGMFIDATAATKTYKFKWFIEYY